MVSALESEASGPSSSPVLCSWARHLTLTVPLFTQVYKWVHNIGGTLVPTADMTKTK